MKDFLVRRWFILLLGVSIVLALFQTDVVAEIVQPIPPSGIVAITLFFMSWTLESGKLWQSIAKPAPALWATVVTYAVAPLLGWLVSLLLPIRDYQIGLMVMTSLPCTIASAAIWTRIAGGNEATSLLVTMLTTCTSWFVTTAWLAITTGTDVKLDVGQMMLRLLLVLVLPVLVGQLARAPRSTRQIAVHSKIALSVISRLLIFIIIMQAVVQAVQGLQGSTTATEIMPLVSVAGACLGIHLAALVLGWFGSRVMGFDRPSQIAVAFSGSQKTLPVGLVLVRDHFPNFPLAVVPVLFFHIGQLLVDSFIADAFARRGPAPEKKKWDGLPAGD